MIGELYSHQPSLHSQHRGKPRLTVALKNHQPSIALLLLLPRHILLHGKRENDVFLNATVALSLRLPDIRQAIFILRASGPIVTLFLGLRLRV